MNNTRRKKLASIQDRIESLMAELEELINEEQEAYDNLPEGLQCSSKGEKMDDAIAAMNEVYDGLADAVDNIELARE